jgi:hypothetical protein
MFLLIEKPMSNEQLYGKIITMYPNFSLYGLYMRYEEWNMYRRTHRLDSDSRRYYETIKDLEFNAAVCDTITIRFEEKDIKAWKSILPDSNCIEYDNLRIYITYNRDDYTHINMRETLLYILVEQSNPLTVKPISSKNQYSTFRYVPECKGDNMEYDEKYVKYILDIDPNFTMKGLYDNLVEQNTIAQELSPKFKGLLNDIKDNIKTVEYWHTLDRIDFDSIWGDNIETIDDIGSWELYVRIVANLYSGYNTSFLNYSTGEYTIVDTYKENFGF